MIFEGRKNRRPELLLVDGRPGERFGIPRSPEFHCIMSTFRAVQFQLIGDTYSIFRRYGS